MSSPPASQRVTSGANGRPPSGMNARKAARRPSMSRGPKRANCAPIASPRLWIARFMIASAFAAPSSASSSSYTAA